MAKKKDFNLVIVESPAKAKTINKFLGKDYKVEASMGHVIDLPKSQLGVDIENNFEPKYITIRGKGKVLKKLRKAVKKSKDVLLATDPDREGEAISWHLARALKLDKEKSRIAFNEITEDAVQNALNNPRPINQDLVDAQQARRLLDRLVGYKLSPLLWKKVRKGLSAGRVQTVAVKIICEREREIEKFEPDEYWSLTALLKKEEQKIEAELHRINGEKFEISSEEEMEDVLADLKEKPFVVNKVKERKRKRNPYPPFTTSTLQQTAASKLNFSAKKTMYIAQQLYEGISLGNQGSVGLISYMRTDSTRISKEAQNEALNYIEKRFGEKYVPDKAKKYQASGDSQDAHEAVRPTSVNRVPQEIKDDLTRDQFRLYKLIWTQFVASQMKPAIYKILTIDVGAGEKYLFRISGSKILFPGFIKLTGSRKDDVILPPLDEGDELKFEEFQPEQHFTQPPPRYSEAKLVKTLEKEGIGRPSTYAPTISTIISREYVERKNKKLIPTELGFVVTDLLCDYFPRVTDVEFTAYLEERLDKIEEGGDEWRELLSEFYFPFAERLETAEEEMEEVNFVEETDEVCEECGSPMVVKYGRYGKFLACSAYPECENTKPYLDKIGVKCPDCEDGEIVQRKSKKGRRFFGCSNYPDCDFVAWDKPVKERCPECGGLMVEKSTRKKGTFHKCINKECKAERVITEEK
ncbi:MAG: type I DNA topoisomerase [Halanaerobiaceae bacterium]